MPIASPEQSYMNVNSKLIVGRRGAYLFVRKTQAGAMLRELSVPRDNSMKFIQRHLLIESADPWQLRGSEK
jgi:hypothetical protein